MPAKNSKLKVGERYNPLNKDLYRKFVEETGSKITFDTFVKIIRTTNEKIRIAAADEEAGVELPEKMGLLLVTKYKSKKRPIDWAATNKLGTGVKVPYLNLHSFGYTCHIKWVKIGMVNFKHNIIYKFEPYRLLKRHVAKNFKSGKKYFKWENSDFLSSTKLERFYNKIFKKEKS